MFIDSCYYYYVPGGGADGIVVGKHLKRKELGGSVVGSLLVKSFKTPNQILKDVSNSMMKYIGDT